MGMATGKKIFTAASLDEHIMEDNTMRKEKPKPEIRASHVYRVEEKVHQKKKAKNQGSASQGVQTEQG